MVMVANIVPVPLKVKNTMVVPMANMVMPMANMVMVPLEATNMVVQSEEQVVVRLEVMLLEEQVVVGLEVELVVAMQVVQAEEFSVVAAAMEELMELHIGDKVVVRAVVILLEITFTTSLSPKASPLLTYIKLLLVLIRGEKNSAKIHFWSL